MNVCCQVGVEDLIATGVIGDFKVNVSLYLVSIIIVKNTIYCLCIFSCAARAERSVASLIEQPEKIPPETSFFIYSLAV
jgi:hypothetical protein